MRIIMIILCLWLCLLVWSYYAHHYDDIMLVLPISMVILCLLLCLLVWPYYAYYYGHTMSIIRSVAILAQGNGISPTPPLWGTGIPFALGHSLPSRLAWQGVVAGTRPPRRALTRHGLGLRLLLALRAGLTRQKMCGKLYELEAATCENSPSRAKTHCFLLKIAPSTRSKQTHRPYSP